MPYVPWAVVNVHWVRATDISVRAFTTSCNTTSVVIARPSEHAEHP